MGGKPGGVLPFSVTGRIVTDKIRLTSYSHGGGCACKLGTDELAQVLRHLSGTSVDPAVLVGLSDPDDAAIYQVSDSIALVQTVDFFTPIVDDPRTWGQIAATNALSDVFAMGGSPKTALNLVGWPRSLDFGILGEVLRGGEEKCTEAGVTIVGGHSVDDPEPKYGLAVTGTIDPANIIRNTGAQPGDALVLTKAIGTGIISSAIKEGVAEAASVDAAITSMTQLNAGGADAMRSARASAATDVTGFSLMGHLLEMLAGRIDAEIDVSAVPLLLGAEDLARRGVLPGGSQRNRRTQIDRVDAGGTDDTLLSVLFDAQTSGGLLIAVPPDEVDTLLTQLRESGYQAASRIGRIKEGDGRVWLTN